MGHATCGNLTQEVDALYSRALDFFGDSAFLHVFIAQYLHEYRANRHLELMHIAAAEVRPSPRLVLEVGCLHYLR